MKYDFIIIGCGISALYLLYLLRNQNLKVCILEKKPYIGGRIQSLEIGGKIIDSGALRFNMNHKYLLKLLDILQITNYKKLISKKNVKLPPKLEEKFKQFINNQKNNLSPWSSVIKQYFTYDENNLLKLWFGYNEEWENSQCSHLCNNLLKNYDANEYFYFPNGFSEVVEKLYNLVKVNPNYHFHLGEKVMKISHPNNIYTMSGNHFTADKIIFACPPHYIANIKGTEIITPILQSVGSDTLNRMYALFPNQKWFPKNVVHCSSPINQIVPIDNELIMISYSSGEDAKFWIEQEQNGKLWAVLQQQLEKVLGKKVEKPKWIKQNYWNPATHYYRDGVNSKTIQDVSFHPFNNWHIIGEAYSNDQGWTNGALENTEIFYKKLIKNNWHKEKQFTMKDVQKNNWMVLFGNVYDVSKWIKIHPGGDVIKYGLGKDATDIFTNVGHSNDAFLFMEKYKIGVLQQ